MQSTLTVGMSVGGLFFCFVLQVTYNRTGHNTLGVVVAHFGLLTAGLGVAFFLFWSCSCFRQFWVLHALCFCFMLAFDSSGCCMLCVFVSCLLSTVLGVAFFVFLFCACLRQAWVFQALCFVKRLLTTDLGAAGFVCLWIVYLRLVLVSQALCYYCTFNYNWFVRLFTTVLSVEGFVSLLYMCLQQTWVLEALCYYCTCIYNRYGCCRACVIIVHLLTPCLGVAGLVSLLHVTPRQGVTCTYHRTGCCRLCVNIVHVLTTGLGVAGSAGTVPVVSVGVTDTAVAPIGWSWIVAESGSCLRAPSTRHTAGTPGVPVTPVPVHWHNCKGRHRCSQGIIK